MNVHDFIGFYMEKNAGLFSKRKNLAEIIDLAKKSDYGSAAAELAANSKARKKALNIANRMQASGKFKGTALEGLPVPPKDLGMLGLPKASSNIIDFINKKKGSPNFQRDLDKILSEAKKRAG